VSEDLSSLLHLNNRKFEAPTLCVYQFPDRILPNTALSFIDFVELCERQEHTTGVACTIKASY
jgi:hypothetical protein